MGGIFGGRNLQGSRCQARSAATSLLHVDGMRAVLMAWEGTLLGGTYNLRGGDSLDHFSDTDVALVVYGALRHEGVELEPRALANRYSAVGISGLLGSDGTYAVALWDRRQDRLWLFTDPLGTQPLCYSRHDGGLAFGPEAKVVLGLLRRTARMDRQSALQFTANRYLLDTRTLFEGVYRLRPGECLSYDARRDEILLERYWDMRYGSDITQTDEAVTLLHDCLVDSHREMLSELAAGDRYTLFLTGGLDSRGILGLTRRLGRPPDQALTWAAHADLPDADPDIGRRLADMAMVPFDVCPLDGTDWLTHARDWCRTSELLSDNASSFATPVDFFSRWQVDGNRFVVLGDEAFGAGSMPSSIDEAAYNILRDAYRNIEGPLQQLLSVDAHEAAKQTLDGDIAGLIAGGPNSSPKDIQDYLYFHTYIARWILAPGNFKAPIQSVRRPLLTRRVLEAVCRLSPLLRVDKRAYIDMLATYLPAFRQVPVTARDAGIDWAFVMRHDPRFRAELTDRLAGGGLDATPLNDAIDHDGLAAFVAAFFARDAIPAPRGDRLTRQLYDVRRQIIRSPGLGRLAHAVQPWVMKAMGIRAQQAAMNEYQILLRLSLLTLFQECLAQGDFDHRARSRPGTVRHADEGVIVLESGVEEVK